MDESIKTDSLLPASSSPILDAIIHAVRSSAPTLRCFGRDHWVVFWEYDEVLVIMARSEGVQLFFDDPVVSSVGDRPTWSSGVIVSNHNAETLAALRGLVRKLQLASRERSERFARESRRAQRAAEMELASVWRDAREFGEGVTG